MVVAHEKDRAVDDDGDTVDFFFSRDRDVLTANAFFAKRCPMVTDRSGSASTPAKPLSAHPTMKCREFVGIEEKSDRDLRI
nr:hypothetical protein [Brucella intermedia]